MAVAVVFCLFGKTERKSVEGMKYGCIGEHLPHSFSKVIHARLASHEYELCELTPNEVGAFMEQHDFCGINVTIPYKQTVIPYLDEMDEAARMIGAVNTVVNRDGKLYGYNTDFGGMRAMILREKLELKEKKVLIFGTGGTSKTARAVATDLGAAEIVTVSRFAKEGAITYEEAYALHGDAEIVINTTPCGMYPNINGIPADMERFSRLEGVVDAIYNPLRSELVLWAQERGIKATGGLYMLVAQAVLASSYFTGVAYGTDTMEEVYRQVFSSKENIVLIGMPGCGKSTVGSLLAESCGKRLIDSDTRIVEKSGMPIPEIFAKYGESGFRAQEHDVIEEIAAESGCVVATGGGAVLDPTNVHALRKNGRIYFLDRPLADLLPTDDRPLANSSEAIRKRFEERYEIYCRSADEVIRNFETAESTADEIKRRHNV